MKASTILKRARARIAKGWTQGVFAKDKNGDEVTLESKKAVSFCSAGAIERASLVKGVEDENKYLAEEYLRRCLPERSYTITAWNDEKKRTKDSVLRVFARAIKKSEKEGA